MNLVKEFPTSVPFGVVLEMGWPFHQNSMFSGHIHTLDNLPSTKDPFQCS
jgi:hypothetical protein